MFFVVVVFNQLLFNSNWRLCTHPISSCWSAALHVRRLTFKLPKSFMAAPLLSSKWSQRFFFSWNFHIITYTVYRAWAMLSRSYFSSFSGSHIENWHSILRNGLVNASYTKLQVEYINSKCLLSLITVWSYRQFQHRKFLCGCSDHRNLSLLSILAPWCCVWERHLFESHFKHIIWIFW